jgi:hypothetical protein
MSVQKFIVNFTLFIAYLVIFTHGLALAAAEKGNVPEISATRTKELLGQPKTAIIDVRRSRSWWQSGKKILSAVREDPTKVDKWAQNYTKDMTLIFYCS